MLFGILVISVLATVTGRAEAARDRCGPGREFLQCGSSCPPKCTDAQQQRPQPCLANCVAGCFCRNGLVEDPNGQCVPPERCPPPKCGKNEIYQTCGTACQPRCGQKAADACVASCEIGCFCAPGYIRHPKKNNCISVAQCAQLVQQDDNNRCKRVNCGNCHVCKLGITGEPKCIASDACCRKPLVDCLRNHCDNKICHLNQNAHCIPNRCGSCNTVWYDEYWNKISC